ncbi:hypothetical protein [Halorubrum xinjiangense]|uniref:hypothetical protein n=1 Tax=Halorubrum xinjiangense TaxID=261291 RepID=UPI00122D58C5|nr:hypothetical protein [Halorubrum xinjiangense]
MSLLQSLRDRLVSQDRSVQYEVQLMTPGGGWKRHEPFHWDGKYGEPDPDDDYLLTVPGRYREIRRVDGRIDEVIWTYETPDAEAHYQAEKEREKLSDLSVDELLTELEQRNKITTLDQNVLIREIKMRVIEEEIEQMNS